MGQVPIRKEEKSKKRPADIQEIPRRYEKASLKKISSRGHHGSILLRVLRSK